LTPGGEGSNTSLERLEAEMRNPIRSESDAFYLAMGSSALIAAALGLGALVDPLVAVALLVGAIIGALVWEVGTKDPQRRRPLREAASEVPRTEPPTDPHVLVVANRTLHGDELRTVLRRRAADGAAFRVVAPILTSRTHYLASDVDKELDEARERLAAALAWARAEGVTATGKVGDANAALGAIEDELRLFGVDEVIISTYPPGQSNWLETGIVQRLREELDVPVTHVVVQPDRAAVS
jgi:GABA permease